MDWAHFDLNLLTVLDAILHERNFTRAGKRLGLSQPAVSHALRRLRILLQDDLLVRGPDGMQPTARAEQLAEPVREALSSLRIALQPQATRPEDMNRAYTIAVNGYTAYTLAHDMAKALNAAAPQLRLTIVPSGTRDVLHELDIGLIDLALTGRTDGGDRFKCSRVMTDRYVAVLRKDHPCIAAALTAQTLGQMRHLTITSTGDNTSFIDDLLEARQLKREVALSLPFLATPEALATSDLVAIMPARVAARLARAWNLAACPLVFETPQVELTMIWHRRLDRQPEHRWLRTQIRQCLNQLERLPMPYSPAELAYEQIACGQ